MRRAATGIVAGLLLLATAAPAEPPAGGQTMGETMGAAIDRLMGDPALKEMVRLHQGAMVSRMFLSAEQWKAFGEFQKQELLALRLGMKASRELFGGAGTAGSPSGRVDRDEALH